MTENKEFKDKYELGKKIGGGGFGTIKEATIKNKDKKEEEKVAVKIIDKEHIINSFISENDYNVPTEEQKQSIYKEIYNEINIMQLVQEKNNRNTVKYLEKYDNENELAIIMELCDTDLKKMLTNKSKPFNDKEVLEILTQLNNTFIILYEHKIYHRDLSLDNILIKEEKDKAIYKLSDYGISKKLVTLKKHFSTKAGKDDYMAPEINQGPYDGKCDLWSLGIIIYILIKKKNPSKGILNIISKAELSNNPDLNDLIRRLLIKEPKERLTWDEYFIHPFFKKNEIIIKLKVTDSDKIENEFTNIYFLEKEQYIQNNNIFEYKENNEELKELNEINTKLFINNEQYPFKKYFKPTEKGEYEIKLIFIKKIQNLSYLFRGCENIISIDLSSFDTTECTNMKYMFGKCFFLKEINLSNLNTSNVIDMSYMFNRCKSLQNIEFPNSFNIQKVEDMSFMFHQCFSLSSINFPSSFDKNNLKNICYLFSKCYKLTKIDLSNLMTENVEDMSFMFNDCTNLETLIINPKKFITKNVTIMCNMFENCNKLKNIDLTSFEAGNVKFTNKMFNGCHQLEEIDLSKMKINEKANIVNMFRECENLQKINLSSFCITNKNTMNNMFDNLKNIIKIIVNKNNINEFKKNFKDFETIFSTN
jgi:surface protein